LLAWHDGPEARTTAAAWGDLQGRPVVFWCWQLDHRVLHQVMQADGSLVLAGPHEQGAGAMDRYVRRADPDQLVRSLVRRARPWREVLRAWLEDQPDGAIEDLRLRLGGFRYPGDAVGTG